MDDIDSQTCSPCWCEIIRPPPIPKADLGDPWNNAWRDLLKNKTVSDALDRYAKLCPGHIDYTTGETKTPTVSSASVTTVLIVLLLVLLVAGLIGFAVYYKKKHGRYFLRDRCRCCTNTWTRMMSAKLSGKYFRRCSSKSSKKEIVEISPADGKGNYSSYEKQECILVHSDEYDGTLENHQISVHSAPQNNVALVNHAKPNDYVDYSNIPPVQSELSTKEERLSNNQDHNYIEPEKRLTNQENIPSKLEKTEESNPEPTESVKRRKKRSKFKRNNKVQSSPEHESDVGVAENLEADKRKTF